MPSSQVRSTACRVEVVTPEHVRLVFDASQADSALLQVTTHNDLGEACGAFSLTFAPVQIQGRTYDQLIPLRSLVTIWMRGSSMTDPSTEAVVMVGLTEDHGLREDYSRGQPQRVVTITGRSMALVFLDMALRHYPLLEDHVQGTLTVGDRLFNLFIPTDFIEPDLDPRDVLRAVLVYFLGVKSHRPVRTRQQHVETQQARQEAQARQPGVPRDTLAQQVPPAPRAQRTAQRVMPISREALLDIADQMAEWTRQHPGASQAEAQAESARLLAAARGQGPVTVVPVPPPVVRQALGPPATPISPPLQRPSNVLMHLQLPGRTLADLLDLNDHTWTMFDTDVRVNVGQNTPYAVSLWHYLTQFVDHTFQEFFTRVEDGVVKVLFRAKPFLETEAFTGSRFVETDPTCQTITYTQETWDAQYLGGQLRRQAANIYNTFLTLPMEAGVMRSQPGYEWLFVPVFLSDPMHPSYLGKYGLRELRAVSPYLTLKKLEDPSPLEAQRGRVERIARQWATKAAAWYGLGSEMYAGTLTVLGNASLNVGHRLLYTDERGEREFYIEGVDHTFDFRTGRYLTQMRVTRGWYLRGLVDERAPSSRGAGALEGLSEEEPVYAQ